MVWRCWMAGGLLALVSGIAQAQGATSWPSRPVRIIVPFTTGSFTDIAARALAKELSLTFRQPFVVESRTGAGGTIGVDAVAKAAPDGYTLLFAENSFAIASVLYRALPYDSAKDIVQVAQLADVPAVVIARKDAPFNDLASLVQHARQRPGGITFGSAGQGTSAHLGVEAFMQQSNIRMTHIPYKGLSAAMIDLVGGRIDVALGSAGTTGAYVKDGRVKGLALSGSTRHPMFPDVPTFAEAGYPQYSFMYWFGVMAPARVPTDILQKLEEGVLQASQQPELRKVLENAGVQAHATGRLAFARRVQEETALWRTVIQAGDIKPE